jgi:hypothetical protein
MFNFRFGQKIHSRLIIAGIVFYTSFQSSIFASINPQLRWINAADVNLRSDATLGENIVGQLGFGEQVELIQPAVNKEFCVVDIKNRDGGGRGYIACHYLSAQPLFAGISVSWTNVSGVNLRAAPSEHAAIVTTLSKNVPLELMGTARGSDYCHVNTLNQTSATNRTQGYVACRYLRDEPFFWYIHGGSNQALEKEFWRNPHYYTLLDYAARLEQLRAASLQPSLPKQKDAALERMKRHLTNALVTSADEPFGPTIEILPVHMKNTALQAGEWHWASYSPRLSQSYEAFNLAKVEPSYFRIKAALAPLDASVRMLSRHFNVPRTIQIQEFNALKTMRGASTRKWPAALGVWDIAGATYTTAQPINTIALQRTGEISTHRPKVSKTIVEYGSSKDYACDIRHSGFDVGRQQGVAEVNLEKTLFQFYLMTPLNKSVLKAANRFIPMDFKQTGFTSARLFLFDLDGDGIDDLTVWEGNGE